MLNEKIVSDIKDLLIKRFDLEKIILFGSQARGTSDNNSDIDLLIISNFKEDEQFNLMTKIRKSLIPIECAFDIVLITKPNFEIDRKYPGTVSRYASKEGLVLYER